MSGYGAIPPQAMVYFPPEPKPTVPDQTPEEVVSYPRLLRVPGVSWGTGVWTIVTLVACYLALSVVFQGAAIGYDLVTGGTTLDDLLANKINLSPALLLGVNLTNASSIILALWLQRLFFHQKGKWLHSVTGTLRWGLLVRGFALVSPIWVAMLILAIVADPHPVQWPTGSWLALGIIIILTTPLQAAGEEYATRGLVAKAAGSWFASPRISLLASTLASATLFTLAHGAGDIWLICFYFTFALAQSFLVWRTGGLELAIVTHTANNLVAFGTLVLLRQDTSAVLDRSAGSAHLIDVALPAGAMLLTTGVLWLWAAHTRYPIARTFTSVANTDSLGRVTSAFSNPGVTTDQPPAGAGRGEETP